MIAPQTGLEPASRYYRPAVFQTAPPPAEGLRHIVGRAGFEPATPEGNGFTDRLLRQFAYLPILISAVRETRTPSPFSRVTGFQDRPSSHCGITA